MWNEHPVDVWKVCLPLALGPYHLECWGSAFLPSKPNVQSMWAGSGYLDQVDVWLGCSVSWLQNRHHSSSTIVRYCCLYMDVLDWVLCMTSTWTNHTSVVGFFNIDLSRYWTSSLPSLPAMHLRRDKYQKEIKLYWVETKQGGRKLILGCMHIVANVYAILK